MFGVPAEVEGLDPTRSLWGPTGHMYARTVYDRLAALDAAGRPRPYLARSILPNANHTSWTISLRPGVRFHNGDRLTARDLAANFAAHQASPLTAPVLANVAGFHARGLHDFVIEMHEPWVPFHHWLAGGIGSQIAYVAHPQVFSAGGGDHPIGTGPFVFKEWVTGDHFTAVRNPRYWRRGLPYLDSVTWKPITDDQSRQADLEAGTIDGLLSSATQTVADLRPNRAFNYLDDTDVDLGETDVGFVVLNLDDPVTGDMRIRLALAHATAPRTYVNLVDNGILAPADGLFRSGSTYYSPTGYPSYDLSRARQLLAAVAAERGAVPAITLSTTTDATALVDASLLQRMWRQAGAQVTIAQFPIRSLVDRTIDGSFQAATGRQFAASDPDLNYLWWSGRTAGPPGSVALNFSRNRDPAIQAALDRGRTTSDPSRRASAYRTVNERLAQDLPYLWLDHPVWMAATSRTVVNWAHPTFPSGAGQAGFFQGIVDPLCMWRSG